MKVLIFFLIFFVISIEAECQTPDFKNNRLRQMEMEVAPKIGRVTSAALIQSNAMLLAPNLEAQVQELANEISKAAGSSVRYKVHIINSPIVNLVSVPSGDIFVFTGFLDKIENRDELAFGLGHEIAHLQQNHGLNQLRHTIDLQRSGTQAAIFLGTVIGAAAGGAVGVAMSSISYGVYTPLYYAGVVAPVSHVVARTAAKLPVELVEYSMAISMSTFSQEQEIEADRLGLIYMKMAGYNPIAALNVGEKLSGQWHAK